MTADILTRLLIANLAAAAAVPVVLAIRRPVRRLAGAQVAYGLWLIAPAAMLACVIPPPTITVAAVGGAAVTAAAAPWVTAGWVMAGWLTGAAAFLVFIVLGQYRAVAAFGLIGADRSGYARAANLSTGPALIGLLRPVIVLPANFEDRFAPEERAMILAHERAHLLHGHLWINALSSVIRAVNWFNPLVHLASRYARLDQELACDAAVVERFPGERRVYAQAMLKTQLARTSLPLGCTWPARSTPMLKERIEMLAQYKPARLRRLAGAGAIVILAGLAAYGAWAAQPDTVEEKLDALLPVDEKLDTAVPIDSVSLHNRVTLTDPAAALPAIKLSNAQAPVAAALPSVPAEGFDRVEALAQGALPPEASALRFTGSTSFVGKAEVAARRAAANGDEPEFLAIVPQSAASPGR